MTDEPLSLIVALRQQTEDALDRRARLELLPQDDAGMAVLVLNEPELNALARLVAAGGRTLPAELRVLAPTLAGEPRSFRVPATRPLDLSLSADVLRMSAETDPSLAPLTGDQVSHLAVDALHALALRNAEHPSVIARRIGELFTETAPTEDPDA